MKKLGAYVEARIVGNISIEALKRVHIILRKMAFVKLSSYLPQWVLEVICSSPVTSVISALSCVSYLVRSKNFSAR